MGRWRPAFQSVTIVDLEHPKHEVSQADIIIDDKPETVANWVASADDRFGILFRQPWNDDAVLPEERAVRAADWHQVLHVVDIFEEVAL